MHLCQLRNKVNFARRPKKENIERKKKVEMGLETGCAQ